MGKKGKSGSKAKLKLPKKVAGVKVPKELRRQAKTLVEFIDSPVGRELAAAGLTLAAAKLAASSAQGGRRTREADSAGEGEPERDVASDPEEDLGEILRATVAEGARRFLAGFEEGRKPGRGEGRGKPAIGKTPEPTAGD